MAYLDFVNFGLFQVYQREIVISTYEVEKYNVKLVFSFATFFQTSFPGRLCERYEFQSSNFYNYREI